MADGPTQPLQASDLTQTRAGPAFAVEPISQIIPGYEILGELHRGGQGVVYMAFQQSTKRLVAIKIPRGAASAGPAELARFQSEVEILAQLKHPHIVTIYDSGIATDGSVYFVMDYIEGQPLNEFQLDRNRPETWGPFLRLFAKVCDAVGAAHQRGVVHCDLKPGNILVDQAGEPRILDFGLARVADSTESGHTATAFIGSLPWASPEQAAGQPLSFPTDVYSLGMILFHRLTGFFPIDPTGDKSQVLEQIILCPPVSARSINRQIDRDLDAIICRCLEKDPSRRYTTAAGLTEDLHRHIVGRPVEARMGEIGYRGLKLTGGLLVRRPFLVHAASVALFCFLAFWLTAMLHARWPGIDFTYGRIALTVASRFRGMGHQLENVVVIAITPDTDVRALAAREGISGVSESTPKSLRRLHGRMLNRLAQAEPRAVALDLYFPGVSQFDEDFVHGVRALRKAGVDVVVGVSSWKLDGHGRPDLSDEIMPEVHWGSIRSDFGGRAPWALELCLLRKGREPRPCFALAAAAAFIEPTTQVAVEVREDDAVCELQYWKPNPKSPQVQDWSPRRNIVPFSGIGGGASPLVIAPDLLAGDRVVFHMFVVPSDEVLRQHTLEYGVALRSSIEELKRRVGGRLVLIADQRKNPDWHDYPDGRNLSGSYGQASGIDSLLSQMAFGIPPQAATLSGLVAAAILGSLAGRWQHVRPIRRALAFLCLTTLLIVLSVFVCPLIGYLCNPTIAILAALGCSEWAAFWARRPSPQSDIS